MEKMANFRLYIFYLNEKWFRVFLICFLKRARPLFCKFFYCSMVLAPRYRAPDPGPRPAWNIPALASQKGPRGLTGDCMPHLPRLMDRRLKC